MKKFWLIFVLWFMIVPTAYAENNGSIHHNTVNSYNEITNNEGGSSTIDVSNTNQATQSQTSVGTVTNSTKVESSPVSVSTPVNVEGDRTEYKDGSVYTSLSTSAGKSEMSVGVPFIGQVTFSDGDKFLEWNRLLDVTMQLKEHGVLTEEEANERLINYLNKMEKEAKAPPRRSLRRLFGLF